MAVEYEKLFTRKATGLVREIGIATAVIIAICNVVGLGWQKRVFQASGWAPVGTSQFFLGIHPVVMAFFLTGIVILLSVYAFAVLAAAMPKSGGGYIFISRILSPPLAFVATWLQFMSVAVSYGMIAVAVMESIMIFGGLAGISLPDAMTSSAGLFIAGALIMLIFSGIAAGGIKQTGRLIQFMFWVPAAILIAIYLLFLAASPQAMAAGVKTLFGSAPEAYTTAAIAQGMDKVAAGNSYWGAVASAILATYWAYIGYAAATFVAGEVKEAGSNMPKAMFISGVTIVVLYVTISSLMARAAGMVGQVGDFSFVQSVAFLNFGGGDFAKAGLSRVGGWMPVMAACQAAGMGAFWIMPLLVVFSAFWVANDIPPFILTSSRMIFAMAFDRVLPASLAKVNERWHSPVNAIIFISAVSLFGAAAEADIFAGLRGTAGDFIYKIINPGGAIGATDIWDAIFFTCVSLAAVYFPLRKPEIFARAPFQHGKTTLQVVGALAFVANLWLLWVVMSDPHGWALLDLFRSPSLDLAWPFLFSIFLILLGYGIYWYYSNQAKRTGVELTTLFTAIPPD